MHIARIGLAVLKGARHVEQPFVRLEETGPVGDRVFALVDPEERRVLRTVENPRLVLVEAAWDGTTLTTTTPEGGVVAAVPRPTGERLAFEYWGRRARVELLASPHAEHLGEHLGRPVRLARVTRPGEVVYAGPVSLTSTGEIAALGETDPARFRATFTVECEQLPEPGTELTIGEAVIRVRSMLPRCRVVDINTATGVMDTRHLGTLAERPRPVGQLPFGIDADVLVPGTVGTGDAVRVQRRHTPCT